MSSDWYVLHCKPRLEASAQGQIGSNRFDYFSPAIHVRPVNRRSQIIKPFFTQYLCTG
jgi:hypothetical protein